MAYDITPELPTIQKIADLLREGKIVYAEMTRKHNSGEMSNEQHKYLFISIEDLSNLRFLIEYRDINILYPKETKFKAVEPRLIEGKTPFEWAEDREGILIYLGDTNEGKEKTEAQKVAMRRWLDIFGSNHGTTMLIFPHTEYGRKDKEWFFFYKEGSNYIVNWGIGPRGAGGVFANSKALSDYLWNYFFLNTDLGQ